MTRLFSAPDGRQWSCQFYEEIESSCSKVQSKKGNILHLVLQKKIPLHIWASLLVGFPLLPTHPIPSLAPELFLTQQIPINPAFSHFLQKRSKDVPKEQPKRTACKENGKEKPPLTGEACEELHADGTAEPPRAKREPSNPKRAPGRKEAAGEKNPASPGLPSGPSAKRAVYVKATLPEEEGSSSNTGSSGLSEMMGNHRNGQGVQGDALLDLKVRSMGGKGMSAVLWPSARVNTATWSSSPTLGRKEAATLILLLCTGFWALLCLSLSIEEESRTLIRNIGLSPTEGLA